MSLDLQAMGLIRDLSAADFELFRAALAILTSRTFIIRGIDRERELYNFTVRNAALFEAWFSCMDGGLVCDENLGVAAFRGSGRTRLYFSREEICAVLVLRLLYEEKRREVTLAAFPVLTIMDFQQKYNAMTGIQIRKTALINVLRRLSSCKLIAVDADDYADPEGLIRLYPSIPFSMDRAALEEAMAFLAEKGAAEEEDGGEADA